MDDLISRRKAFEYFVTLWECIGTIMDRDEWEDICMTTANEIPSAEWKGKWICETDKYYSENVYCSICKSRAPYIYVCNDPYGRDAHGERKKTNYCPECGADMRGDEMAEFIGETEKSTNIGESVVFENKTDSAFEVSMGIVFHKSGIYEVSVLKNKTIVSKVTERKKGKWIWNDEMKCFLCSECERGWREQPTLNGKPLFEWCPVCGADMRGEQDV